MIWQLIRTRRRALIALGLAWTLTATGTAAPASAGDVFLAKPLATDATDSQLINPWGISASGTSPFWISDNGTGVSTLYAVDPNTNVATQQALSVAIPGDGSVTGQVFNSGTGFNNDRFLFVSEDGTISGWRGAQGTTAEVLQLPDANNIYKGVTLETVGGHSYLLSANFQTGKIDVLKGDAGAPDLAGRFTDPGIPDKFAPFNISKLGNTIYVTYALKDGKDDKPGSGNGFVSAFDVNGNFISRIGSKGMLNSPWGLAIAPSGFGSLAAWTLQPGRDRRPFKSNGIECHKGEPTEIEQYD